MNAERLLAHYERIADAPDAINRLRRFILDLAVRGKLVPQDPKDEPAIQLVRKSFKERNRLVESGKTRKINSKIPKMAYVPFDLPAAWQWVKLGEFFSYDAGVKRSPETLNPSFWLLDLEDIEKDTGRVHTQAKVSDRKPSSTKSEFKAGDILYGKLRPYLNKVVVADEAGYSTTEIVSIRPFIPISTEYCAMALRRQDFVAYVERSGQGTKMPRLRKNDALIAPFPLPPVSEQYRIVTKVDELMSLCDKLEAARLKRDTSRNQFTLASLAHLYEPDPATFQDNVQFVINNFSSVTASVDQINQIRQTILNLAVRGKLVLQDTDEEPETIFLLKSDHQLQSLDIPGWVTAPVGSLLEFKYGKGLNSTERLNEGPVPVYGSNGIIGYSMTSLTDMPSIIVGRKGSAGSLNLCNGPSWTTDVSYFVEAPEYFDLQYLLIGLKTLNFFSLCKGVKPGLSRSDAYKLDLSVPPIAEQRRIVSKVNELMALCDRLDTNLSKRDILQNHLLDALVHEVLVPAAGIKQAA